MRRTSFLPTLMLGLTLPSACLPAAPATLLTDDHGISGFELSGNGIYWWSGVGRCSGEFPYDATVRLRGTLFSSTKSLALDCRLHQSDAHNTVRDAAYFYFFYQGVLHRKAVNAAESDPSQVMPAPGGATQVTLPTGHRSAYLDLDDGQLYWASYDSSTEVSTILRMPTDGSANPTSLGSIGGQGGVRKLEHFTYRSGSTEVDALAVLLADGRLYRRNPGSLFWLQLSSGVADFAIHRRTGFLGTSTTYVYAAKGVSGVVSPSAPAGTLERIDVSDGDSATIYTASGRNQILAVATDSTSSSLVVIGAPPKNVYLLEGRVECGGLFCSVTDGSIRRHALPGSTSGWELIVASGAAGNLRSDDQYLYFLDYNIGRSTSILRLPTDVPPIEIRLDADTLEVVQNSQDLNNSISLVANKPTFVRAYAHLSTNTTGSSTWFPSATLRGQRNGVDLPGSPLSHINNTAIDTTSDLDTLRSEVDKSFLFELPASWSAPGTLTLTFTVNASQGIPETGPSPSADNTIIRSVSFTRKDRPCLVLVPMRTTAPLYNPNASDSGLADIVARARSLLPVEDFRIFTVSEPIEKLVVYVEVEYVPCFPFICAIPVPKFRHDPFDLQDDEDWALFWLTFAHFFSSNPDGCPDTHWVGTVHRNIQGFNGIGGRSDLTLNDISDDLPGIPIPDFGTSDFLVVRMATDEGENPWDRPLGGRTLAHELGHNYGRKHIDQTQSGTGCGGSMPEGPYDNYPFDECTIGSAGGNSAVFGFDPISRSVLAPSVGGDLMSYSTTRWISKFTWDAIRQKTITVPGGLPAPMGVARKNGAEPLLLANGFISPEENLASIRPGYVLPAGTADEQKVARSLDAMAKIDADNPYRLRLADLSGQPLSDWPLLLAPVSDGTSSRLGFVQFVPWNPATRRLQLWRDDTLLAEKLVSLNAPMITLDPPNVNSAEGFVGLSWTASDPDQEPLLFTVQYSADDGANWLTLRLNYPFQEVRLNSATLPGSMTARVRVIATDGVQTAMATSAPFLLAPHAPVPVISGVTEGERIPYGSPVQAQGVVLDAEDGSLEESRLEWTVTGPIDKSSQGSSLSLYSLPPGLYEITLTGMDSGDATGESTKHIEVLPMEIPDGAGIRLDGSCSDRAYVDAAFARIPLGDGSYAAARLVRAGGRLHVSVSDLPYGGRFGNTSVGIRIDADAGGDATPQAGDIGFYVDEDGIGFQVVPSGTTMQPTLSPQLGAETAVARGPSSWSAELNIDDPLIGGWNHAIRLVLHCDEPSGTADGQWPPAADVDSPATWAPAYLGALPAPSNRLPVAIAGPDQSVPVPLPTTVYLDGAASYDSDGDPLAHAWTQVTGPEVTLDDALSATPHFIAEPSMVAANLRFRLVVNDGALDSAPAEVEVTLLPAAPPPAVTPLPKGGNMLADGSFFGCLTGDPEQRYEIQATTNFLHWTPIGSSVSDFYGIMTILDADASQFPHRFYRGRKP